MEDEAPASSSVERSAEPSPGERKEEGRMEDEAPASSSAERAAEPSPSGRNQEGRMEDEAPASSSVARPVEPSPSGRKKEGRMEDEAPASSSVERPVEPSPSGRNQEGRMEDEAPASSSAERPVEPSPSGREKKSDGGQSSSSATATDRDRHSRAERRGGFGGGVMKPRGGTARPLPLPDGAHGWPCSIRAGVRAPGRGDRPCRSWRRVTPRAWLAVLKSGRGARAWEGRSPVQVRATYHATPASEERAEIEGG